MTALDQDTRAFRPARHLSRPSRTLAEATLGSEALRRRLLRSLLQSFEDLWILIAFNSLLGVVLLLIEMSDSGRPSVATTCLCLVVPPAANVILIVVDAVSNTFATVAGATRAPRNLASSGAGPGARQKIHLEALE